PSASQIVAIRFIFEGSAAALRSCAYHFGRFLTSLSHFANRRLRSSDEPYLAKSKLISLISVNFGACGGIGVFLLDGNWKFLVLAPSAWAAGVSAQSYHFFALSRLRAPSISDRDPI